MHKLPDSGFLFARNHAEDCRTPGFGSWTRPVEGGEFLVDRGNGHAIILAPTEAGKKRNILLPTLLSSRDPVIAIDIKGELARESADFRRDEFGHQVVILDPWKEVSDGKDTFNFLDALDPMSENLADDAQAQAQLVMPTRPSREAFWDDRAQGLISGLIAHVLTSPAEDDRSLARVWQMLNADDPVFGLAVLLDTAPVTAFARSQIASFLSIGADVTRSCVLSTAQQHVQSFASDAVHNAIRRTTFDLNAVRNGDPLSIYIVVPPAKLRSHGALIRLWLSALLNLVLQRKRCPERSTLLLLDEVAQLGRMDQVPLAVTLARGYGLRCMLFLQSYAQLRQVYPLEHEVLMENSAAIVTFGHTAFSMSHQMAAALGDISAEALFDMGHGQVAVRTSGARTRILPRVDYLTDVELRGRAAANPMFAGRAG